MKGVKKAGRTQMQYIIIFHASNGCNFFGFFERKTDILKYLFEIRLEYRTKDTRYWNIDCPFIIILSPLPPPPAYYGIRSTGVRHNVVHTCRHRRLIVRTHRDDAFCGKSYLW